jgi:hypothetical protein
MKLIENWKDAWRWFSVQSMAISGAALAGWAMFPDDLKAALPAEWVAGFAVGVLVFGIVGRLVDQGGAKK